MKTKSKYIRSIGLSLLILVLATGCGAGFYTGERDWRTENHSVDLGEANSARIQIALGVGDLSIHGGASKLMEGAFDYTLDDRRPEISYQVSSGEGVLLVSQPEEGSGLISREGLNRWDLRFNEQVPIDLEVYTGIGESVLDFSAIDLTRLKIESGAGDGTFDLSGVRRHDLDVAIKTGLGEIKVILPQEMGVRVTLQLAIGEVNMPGFRKDGEIYVNEAFGDSSETLEIAIESGIGGVDLELR